MKTEDKERIEILYFKPLRPLEFCGHSINYKKAEKIKMDMHTAVAFDIPPYSDMTPDEFRKLLYDATHYKTNKCTLSWCQNQVCELCLANPKMDGYCLDHVSWSVGEVNYIGIPLTGDQCWTKTADYLKLGYKNIWVVPSPTPELKAN